MDSWATKQCNVPPYFLCSLQIIVTSSSAVDLNIENAISIHSLYFDFHLDQKKNQVLLVAIYYDTNFI